MSDYTIGYGRPPKSTQFKPGQSGNPHGRPKGSMNLETIINKLLNTKVTIETSKGQKKLTKREAIPLQLINQAVAGDLHAMALVLPLIKQTDEKNERVAQMLEDISAEDEAILQGMNLHDKSSGKPAQEITSPVA